jgi:hypothetical protein
MPSSQNETTGPIKTPKQVRYAVIAMLVLVALTCIGVAAYFAQNKDPWTWRGLVAIATIPFSLVCAGLMWKFPTRENASASLLVIAFSLVRIGLPDEWTTATYVLIVITLLIAAPVAWAARTLPP